MPTLFRRLPILVALAAGCAPVFAQTPPAVDLKKWPKGQPIESVLLKDEKALYKRLANDEERGKFTEFVYARRSTAQNDFHKLLAYMVDTLDHQFKVEFTSPTTGKKLTVYEGWDTDPGRIALALGLPDNAATAKDKEATYSFHYTRKLPGVATPVDFDFKVVPQAYMGSTIEVMRYNSSFPVSIWETLLPPAGADWESYKADPASVKLKECVPLTPTLCAAQAVPQAAAAGEPGGEPADLKMAAGALTDPDFSINYPDGGSIPVGLNVSFLPTQVAGDVEIRIVLAAEGQPFTGKAHLIPAEGSTGQEQDFAEADFKGVTIKGRNYVEARRSVKAGRYLLAAVALRGAEFGRKTMNVEDPKFKQGQLSIAASMVAEKAEHANTGDPLTFGDVRILPRTGKMKAGDLFSIYAVAYGGIGGPAYQFEADLTCHVEFGVGAKSKHKIDFGKSGVQEAVCLKVTSSSPLIGFEDIKIPAPSQASVKIGADVVPIKTTVYKVKYVIRDLLGGQTVESGWITIPLE